MRAFLFHSVTEAGKPCFDGQGRMGVLLDLPLGAPSILDRGKGSGQRIVCCLNGTDEAYRPVRLMSWLRVLTS